MQFLQPVQTLGVYPYFLLMFQRCKVLRSLSIEALVLNDGILDL